MEKNDEELDRREIPEDGDRRTDPDTGEGTIRESFEEVAATADNPPGTTSDTDILTSSPGPGLDDVPYASDDMQWSWPSNIDQDRPPDPSIDMPYQSNEGTTETPDQGEPSWTFNEEERALDPNEANTWSTDVLESNLEETPGSSGVAELLPSEETGGTSSSVLERPSEEIPLQSYLEEQLNVTEGERPENVASQPVTDTSETNPSVEVFEPHASEILPNMREQMPSTSGGEQTSAASNLGSPPTEAIAEEPLKDEEPTKRSSLSETIKPSTITEKGRPASDLESVEKLHESSPSPSVSDQKQLEKVIEESKSSTEGPSSLAVVAEAAQAPEIQSVSDTTRALQPPTSPNKSRDPDSEVKVQEADAEDAVPKPPKKLPEWVGEGPSGSGLFDPSLKKLPRDAIEKPTKVVETTPSEPPPPQAAPSKGPDISKTPELAAQTASTGALSTEPSQTAPEASADTASAIGAPTWWPSTSTIMETFTPPTIAALSWWPSSQPTVPAKASSQDAPQQSNEPAPQASSFDMAGWAFLQPVAEESPSSEDEQGTPPYVERELQSGLSRRASRSQRASMSADDFYDNYEERREEERRIEGSLLDATEATTTTTSVAEGGLFRRASISVMDTIKAIAM